MATPAEQLPESVKMNENVMTPEQALSRINLIGIAGSAGTGKDTLAEYIVGKFGAQRMSLADPIKAILNSIFGFAQGSWDDRNWKERPIAMIGVSPRRLAQTLGTEWGRMMINEDLWISKLIGRWRDSGGKLTVVPDVRFVNEAVYLMRSGGLMIRVTREDAPPVLDHASEQPIPDQLIHFELQNNGSIDELHEAFDRAIVQHVIEATARAEQRAQGNAVSQ